MNFIIPLLIILLIVCCFIKKINAYSSFCEGAKKGIKLSFDLLPFIVCIMLMLSLMQISGVTQILIFTLSPVLNFLGIPTQLCEFVCLRPLTGSGSIALLNDIIATYGTESYITKCACVMMSCTETVFFTSTIYFSKTKKCNTALVLLISLTLCFLSMIFSCFLCRILFC